MGALIVSKQKKDLISGNSSHLKQCCLEHQENKQAQQELDLNHRRLASLDKYMMNHKICRSSNQDQPVP